MDDEIMDWMRKHGKTAGGLYALAAAGNFWFDMKGLGLGLAALAILFVVSSEYDKSA